MPSGGARARSGRRPLPSNVVQLRGNPGHRPLPKDEPVVEIKAPICPKWLGPVARQEWHWIVPKLTEARVIAEIDRAALLSYCTAYETLQLAYAQLRQVLEANPNAHMLRTAKGFAVNPLYRIIAQAKKELNVSAAEFGLSPSARTRIAARAASPGDDDGEGAADLFD